MVLEYCDNKNLDIRTASNITICAIIATCAIYLISWYYKITDNELELYDMSEEHNTSEEHNDESLHEEYVLIIKPHSTSKVWAHFGLKGNKDGLYDPVEIEKSICHHCPAK